MEEDFRILGRIERTAPAEFVLTVTSVPESGNPAGIQTLTATCESMGEARGALRALMAKMGDSVRATGGCVTDTEVNGLSAPVAPLITRRTTGAAAWGEVV